MRVEAILLSTSWEQNFQEVMDCKMKWKGELKMRDDQSRMQEKLRQGQGADGSRQGGDCGQRQEGEREGCSKTWRPVCSRKLARFPNTLAFESDFPKSGGNPVYRKPTLNINLSNRCRAELSHLDP